MALSKFKLTAAGEALVKQKQAGKAKGKLNKNGQVFFIDSLTDEQAAILAGEKGTNCQYLEPVQPQAEAATKKKD